MEDLGYEFTGHRETDNSYWYKKDNNEVIIYPNTKKFEIHGTFDLDEVQAIISTLEELCI